MRRVHLELLAFTTLLIAAGCTAATDNGGDNGGGVHLTSIDVTSASDNLAIGDSVDLVATGHYSDGSSKVLTDSASWTSDHPASVTVGNTAGTRGRAVWAGGGTAMITASYLGVQGMKTITAVGINSIEMTPSTNAMVDSAGTLQITATAHLSDATTLDVTSLAGWTSSDTNVAKVNNAANKGRVSGVARGTATIIAGWNGALGQVSVTTLVVDSIVIANQTGALGGYFPIGGTLQLRATAFYSTGSMQTITDSATWSSSTAAMSVSSTGLASRTGADSSFVQAQYRGKKGKALLHKGCEVLATDLSFDGSSGIGVGRLKVDGGGVVWLDNDGSGGAFRTVAATGGAVTTIRSGLPYIGQWDMDANYIYWMWVDSLGAQDYHVVRMSRASGTVDTLYSSIGLGGGARGLAVDANYIYYAPGNDGGVRRMPIGGGAYTSYFNTVNYGPRELALSGGVVYAAIFDANPHWIVAVPTTGAALDTLGQAPDAPTFQQVSSSYFYVARSNAGPISRVPVGGGSVTAVANGNSAQGFAIASGNLYYAQVSAGTSIVRSPIAGGTVQTVTDACGLSPTTALKVEYLTTDGTYIYFSDDGGGTGASRILRVKK